MKAVLEHYKSYSANIWASFSQKKRDLGEQGGVNVEVKFVDYYNEWTFFELYFPP